MTDVSEVHGAFIVRVMKSKCNLNPLNAELNPIYHLLALLGAHHIFHISGLRVNDNSILIHALTTNEI